MEDAGRPINCSCPGPAFVGMRKSGNGVSVRNENSASLTGLGLVENEKTYGPQSTR